MPVEWQPQPLLHLTLNFLGPTPEDSIPQIKGVTRRVVSTFEKFTLVPAFLETLYSRHEKSKIYLGIAGQVDMLIALQQALNSEYATLKLPQQNRYLPHITVGRLKRTDPTSTKQYLDQVAKFEFTPLPAFTVERVTLFESLVSKTGPYYQVVDQFSTG